MLFSHDRAQIREVFFQAWRHYRDQRPLDGVEKRIVTIALRHPEYHTILESPDIYHDSDYLPETGKTNPFLHMGMHITIEEQLALDQPKGIQHYYQQLLIHTPDDHAVQHKIMECLSEILWQAQRNHTLPNDVAYLACLDGITTGKGV